MANLDAPKGFKALQNEAGTAPKLQAFTAKSGVTIYEGTPVSLNTTGQLVAYSVATSTAAKKGLGVAAHYRVGSSAGPNTVLVYTDPHQLYEVQSDDNTLTTIGDVVYRNFKATNLSSGSGTTLQSTAEIDGSTGTSVQTITSGTDRRPFKAVGFSRNLQNDNSTSWNKIIVQFNPSYHMGANDQGV